MINPQKWIENYTSFATGGLAQGRICLLAGTNGPLNSVMIERYTQEAPTNAAFTLQVKQVLDGLGVSMAQYAMYLAFGRELYSLRRREISGESAQIEYCILKDYYTAMGLIEAVLAGIGESVFGFSPCQQT